MAFQMIPPRVSSSPPPLDSLPTITCHQEDEDDDDFADYSGGHNASFDITGLSDKLPPTPTSSPTKTFPSITQCVVANSDQIKEKITDSTSQNLDVSRENQKSEISHKLPSENENCGDFQNSISVISNVNGEISGDFKDITEGKLSDNDDDFGDFECFPGENESAFGNNFSGAVVEENFKNLTNCKESTDNGAIIDSSSQILPSSISKDGEIDTPGSQSPPCFRSTLVSNSNDLSPPRSPSPTMVSSSRSPPPPTMVSPPRSPPLRSPPPNMMSPPPLDKLAQRSLSEDDQDEFGDFTTGHPGIMEDEDDDDFGDFTSTNLNSLSNNCDSNNTIISSNINLVSPSCHKEFIENKESKANEINSINRSKGFSSDQLENCTDNEVKGNGSVDVEVDTVLSEDTSTVFIKDRQPTVSGELHGAEELTEERLADEILTNQNQIMINSSDKNNIEISNDARTLELDDTNKQDNQFVKNSTIDSNNKSSLHENYKSDNECNDDDFGDFEGNFVQSNELKSINDDDNDFDDFVSPENVIDDIRTTSENLDDDVSKSSSLVNNVKSSSKLNPSNVDDDEFGDFDSARRDSLDFEDIRSQVVSRGISEGQYNDDLENNGDDDAFGDFENASFSNDPVSVCDKDRLDDINDFGDFADFDTKHDIDDDDEFGDFNTPVESETVRTEASSNMNDINNSQAMEQKFSTNEEDKSQVVKKLESLLLRWIPPINRDVRTTDNNTKRLQQVVKEDAFIWHQLEDLDSSPALNLDWPQSHAQKLFLSSVNVDARNIEKIPEAKFDWTSSGLTNPLESTGLEREFLSEGSSKSGRVKAPPSPSPLVQQILSGGTVGGGAGSSLTSRNTTSVTQINSLQPEVQQIVAKLPELNFMKSRVLMFPIKGEQL